MEGTPERADLPPAGEEMPRIYLTRRAIIALGLFVASALALFYFVVPRLAGAGKTWDRLDRGDPAWLGVAVALELVSFVSYVALFRAVFIRGETRVGWRESYQITMAGLAATRLFASAGAGGIVLTVWALRRSGMAARVVACRMIAFLALLYGVYMVALVVIGIGLRVGLLEGGAPFGITVIPAAFGAAILILMSVLSALPAGFERRLQRQDRRSSRFAKLLARAASVPVSVAEGTRAAIRLVRTRDPALLGAIGWWGFDIATLWASFHAFGHAPPWAVIIMGYFVGMLANVLPFPGGIGGIEGGMIGAFLAFGVSGSLALVAVITYRAFAFWLPTIPGAIAYLQLRRTVRHWRRDPAVA